MTLQPIPRSLSRAGFLTELEPAARRNVFMSADHLEDMLAHAAARFSLQLQKQDRVSISANAMREMLDELLNGEVSEINGTPVMRMPDGFMTREYGEWVEIVPALDGWVDCMRRIVPDLSSGAIVDLAGLLRAGEDITPELVMVARIQLEDQIQAMKRMPIGAINAAVESTKSDWRKEEKLKEETEMNARNNAPALPAIDGIINAAHKALAESKAPLCGEDVAKAINATKRATKLQIKEAEKQLKELFGLGILESQARAGGVSFYSLTVAPEQEAKTGNPAVEDDGCSDACASNGGDSHEASGDAIDWTAPELQYLAPEDYEMPPADPVLLSSANRMLSDRLEGVAHALRGCGLPALAEISGAEDLQMATAALSGAYQMVLADKGALDAERLDLNQEVRSLLGIIADIRAAIGDPEGKIMLGDLAAHIQRDIGELIESLGVEKRVSGSAISAVAHICEHLGCDDHNGHVPALRAIDALRSQINSLTTDVTNTRRALNDALNEADRMRTELIIERQAQDVLRRLIKASPAAAAKGYILKTPKQAMRRFGKEAAAQSAAMAAARAGKTGEVFALVPVGKAVRGAEWRAAEGAAK